jgi:hypothetical protein
MKYFAPLARADVLAAAWLAVRPLADRFAAPSRAALQGRRTWPAWAAIMLAILTVYRTLPVRSPAEVIRAAALAPGSRFSPTLGLRLGPGWEQAHGVSEQVLGPSRDTVQGLFGPEGRAPLAQGDVWSVYAGLPQAERGLFNPGGVDYLIHALGPGARARYAARFEEVRPRFMLTPRRTFFPYESWLQVSSWPLYELLVRNYEPVGRSAHELYWERRPGGENSAGRWERTEQVTSATTAPVPLPSREQKGLALLSVEVSYRIENPWRRVPLIGSLPRYFVHVEGARGTPVVSLPPYEERWQFPVFVRTGDSPRLRWEVRSLVPGARLAITEVRARAVEVPRARVEALLEGE